LGYWEAVILGIVQGLTEFLPVSSSGHLVLGKALFGLTSQDIAFEVFVHFGTLLAVLTIFKREVVSLLKGMKAFLLLRFASENTSEDEREGLTLLKLVTIGTLPAATIGFMFKEMFEEAFLHPEFVCGALIATGLLLLSSRFANERTLKFDWLKSLIVGVAQIAAILPGISRSGTTITTGMLVGVERTESARFSFLLAIPLILAATVLQSVELLSRFPSGKDVINLVIGTVAAYGSGLFAIKWLMRVVQHGNFDRFAYYCIVVGVGGLFIILF